MWFSTAYAAAIQFQDVSAQAGFNNITTSYGASWGDINGDGFPDLFANNHARRNSIYVNKGDGTFSDRASTIDALDYWSGAGGLEDTHGGSWADFDNDGDQDLLISTGNCCDPQFLVNRRGQLYYRSKGRGFGDDVDAGGRMPIWFDIDDDGFLDTIIMSFFPAPLMQQESGSFTRLPFATMQCKENQFASLIDANVDRHLDIICVDKGSSFAQAAYDFSSSPFINFASSFPDVAAVNEVITGDFDGDLRTDMLLLRGSLRPSEVRLFGDNTIEAMFVKDTSSFSFQSTGTVTIDIDWNKTFENFGNIWIGANGGNPGSESLVLDPSDPAVQGVRPYTLQSYPEIYIGYDAATQTWSVNTYSNEWMTAYFEVESSAPISNLQSTGIKPIDEPVKPVLLKNGPSGFVDVTEGSGLDEPMWCVGGTSGDFDNDGDLDIYLVCRGGVRNVENRMYENDGNGNFTLVANEGGANSPVGAAVKLQKGTGEGVVSADYDVDGRLDLFVTNGLNMRPRLRNGGPDQLFRNVAPARNWVELDLVGTVANRDGIGAIVFATANGKTQLREQDGGFHRWSQDHQRLHFGLGDNTTVDLEIQWPSGRTDVYTNVSSNKLYRVIESTAIQEVVLGGGGGGPAAPKCFRPGFDTGSEPGLFVWSDCDGSGTWHVRASPGGSSSLLNYAGDISSNNDFVSAREVSFEASDVLDISTNPQQARFSLNVGGSGRDGFDFVLPEGSDVCLDLSSAPAGANVVLGQGKLWLNTPINLNNGAACEGSEPLPTPTPTPIPTPTPTPVPTPTPTPEPEPEPLECGEPPFNPATDGAILIYKDCDADNWHVRAGASAGFVRYTGSIIADKPIAGLTPVNLESSDTLEVVYNDKDKDDDRDNDDDIYDFINKLIDRYETYFSSSSKNTSTVVFGMSVSNPYFDGFDFTLACSTDATFSLDAPGGATVLVGPDRVPAPATFNLDELSLCRR